jgi:hypothetical protein
LEEVERYTKAANRKTTADAAMAKLSGNDPNLDKEAAN